VSASCYGGDTSTVVFEWACPTVPGAPVYSGTIPVEGVEVDLAFHFKVENGTCYFCLYSAALGVYGEVPGDCHVIDAAARAHPDHFCSRFSINGQAVQWDIAAPFCGSGYISIAISPAENQPITNRPRYCLDAGGYEIEDTHPIRDLCCQCSCLCECACITTYGDDLDPLVELACLDGTTSYTTYSGVEIGIVANYETGNCELELIDPGPITLADPELSPHPPNVSIGGTGNECPDPTAQFAAFDVDGKAVFFEFHCAPCGDCQQIPVTLCCNALLPRVLVATIDGGYDCPCGSTSIPLIYDDSLEEWRGTQPTGFCDHTITLKLTCSGGGDWSLTFQADPCVEDSVTGGGSCSPVLLIFTVETSGIGCCGDGDFGGLKTLTITITE